MRRDFERLAQSIFNMELAAFCLTGLIWPRTSEVNKDTLREITTLKKIQIYAKSMNIEVFDVYVY